MGDKIDLVLVKPGGRMKLFGSLASSLSGFSPPLDIGLIASFIREKGYSVRVIDADAEFLTPAETADKIAGYSPLLSGIFAHTIRMMHAAETIRELKKKAPGIKTLLGGRHPSALPEKSLIEEKPDFVCQGEAFYPILELLEALISKTKNSDYNINGIWHINNKVISHSPPALMKDLDQIPFIAWDLLPMDKYRAHNWQCFDDLSRRQPYAVIYSSLGCPYKCSYCCINATYGSPGIRFRSPARVAEEVDYLVENYKVRNIRILDDVFTFNQEHAAEVCDLIIERGYDLNMWCYSRIDTVNEYILQKMRRAGIRWLCCGIEAGQQNVREDVLKNLRLEKIKQGVEKIRQAGIYIIANFIFGLPEDTIESMEKTLDMAKEFNFEYVNFYAAMAWPGSKLYEEALRAGWRLPEDWSGYAQLTQETLPLSTKYVSAGEVLRFRDKAFVEYFSNPSYLKMIEEKFSAGVAGHITGMLEHKLIRKFASK